MNFTNNEIEVFIEALEVKKALLEQELANLERLINKTRDAVVMNNTVIDGEEVRRRRRVAESRSELFEKVRLVLLSAEGELTSREILQELYKEYPDEFKEKDDRKNIAAVSALLYAKVSEGEVKQFKREREQARFKLIKDVNYELEQLDKEIKQKAAKRMIQDDEDFGLPF